MKEQDIRSVLIEYLKAQNMQIRLFKEKEIGGSICDLMAVTDIVTGYEIKSDYDDYNRIENQISHRDLLRNLNNN